MITRHTAALSMVELVKLRLIVIVKPLTIRRGVSSSHFLLLRLLQLHLLLGRGKRSTVEEIQGLALIVKVRLWYLKEEVPQSQNVLVTNYRHFDFDFNMKCLGVQKLNYTPA